MSGANEGYSRNVSCPLNLLSAFLLHTRVIWYFEVMAPLWWWSVLLVEKSAVPGENHRPAASY